MRDDLQLKCTTKQIIVLQHRLQSLVIDDRAILTLHSQNFKCHENDTCPIALWNGFGSRAGHIFWHLELFFFQFLILPVETLQASKNPLDFSSCSSDRASSIFILNRNSEQKFAKETFKLLPSYFTLTYVVFR